jgi:DNA-binding NtrC family response regulator
VKTRILVVDDVETVAEQYAYDLRRLADCRTLVATGGREAVRTLEEEAVDCVILDLEMPGVDGFDVLRAIRDRELDVPVIVYTGTGDYDRCARAVRLGAFSFIDKSEPMRRVVQEIRNAVERERLSGRVERLRERLGEDEDLVGTSPVMLEMKERISKLATVPSPVLIQGESGTGKELVARQLHRLGPGEERPFVAVNSAALPENLVESELFGHEKGAFTGAERLRKGAFEAAGEGTLFLDEVGDLPASAQAKLLRVLEEREVSRVGGNRTVEVSARVVAATHRDLEEEVDAGRFRQDLHFRLNVHVLRVPPLRERLSDVPALARHFLARTCRRYGIPEKEISSDALEILAGHEWRKNNVRELRNIVERMVIAGDGDVLGPGAVPAEIRRESVPLPTEGDGDRGWEELKAEAQRRVLVAALERHGWRITRTAEALDLADHSSLLKIMRRLGVERPEDGG